MTDRERFERALDRHPVFYSKENGEYINEDTQNAWIVWQAATRETAQRCFELCDDPVEAQRIAAEFGLKEGDA